MRKDKIFELKIEEDDELSGIDSISLVDEPAIEVNWVAFKKEKEHEFHIPDGEDHNFLDKLIPLAQDEQELFDQGWTVHSVQIVGEEDFVSTSPNAPSVEDEEEYNVRYKYILNPRIAGQSAVISTTRDFCKNLIAKNYVWRVEDMEATRNDFGDSAMVWRGGYNCRHVWSRIEYKKDATIVNKASINKGKVEVGGFPSGTIPDPRVLGYAEPNTVTNKTLNNPSPSTVRNLGLAKEKFAGMKVSLDYDGTFSTLEGKLLAERLLKQGYDVHIVTARQDTTSAEVYRRAESVGIPRSKVHFTNGKSKVPKLRLLGIKKHYDNNVDVVNEIRKDGAGIVAVKFDYNVSDIVGYVEPTGSSENFIETFGYLFESHSDYPDSVKNNAKAVLKWVEENGWGSCGTDVGKQRANQLAKGEPISEDTIRRMYSYLSRHEKDLESSKGYGDGCGKLMYDSWGGKTALRWAESKINTFKKNEMSKQYFQIDNEEKRIVLGPAMIAGQKIFRKDKNGDPYYVWFSSESIRMIAEKYMKNQYTRNNDLMHNGKAINDIYVIESWIKEDENDKSVKYGYGDIPVGSWFVSMKIPKTPKGDEVWQQVKEGKLNGFSVSGYFSEEETFSREEMFLYQVAEILKKY